MISPKTDKILRSKAFAHFIFALVFLFTSNLFAREGHETDTSREENTGKNIIKSDSLHPGKFSEYIGLELYLSELGEERFVVLNCNEKEECDVLGKESGYPAEAIKKLKGNAQKYFGAPISVAANFIGGIIGGLSVGIKVAKVAKSGNSILESRYGFLGAFVGGWSANLVTTHIPQDLPYLRQINPVYHWKKGSTKADFEAGVDVYLENFDVKDHIVLWTKKRLSYKNQKYNIAYDTKKFYLEQILQDLD
jgi:hypothetical protein